MTRAVAYMYRARVHMDMVVFDGHLTILLVWELYTCNTVYKLVHGYNNIDDRRHCLFNDVMRCTKPFYHASTINCT